MKTLIQLFACPAALGLAYYLMVSVVPHLDPDIQHAIYDGGPGMVLGSLGGLFLMVSSAISWHTVKDLWKQNVVN